MSLEPTLAEQELLADTLRRAGSGLTTREVLGELVVGVGFVLAAATLWWQDPPHGLAVIPAIMCMAVLVLAARVRFETPLGFTVATQLAFVPLLFAIPVGMVPVMVAVGLVIARLPDVLARRVGVGKLLGTAGNAWFAVGPAAVFAVAQIAPRHAGAALLLTALGAQFVVDFGAAALYFGIGRQASLRTQLTDTWVYVIDAALSGVGLVVAEQLQSSAAAVLAVIPLLGLLAMFAHERSQRLRSLLALGETYKGTALLLADVVTADDQYTGEHSRGVVGLALAVGDQLGLDAEQRRNLEFGALLHDVGKITIPKEIINKPGPLDPAEWALIKTHTLEGEKMLARVGGFMREVGQIVRSHHERWDGEGYPDGISGTAIPLAARIISCCDAWSAMRTDRPYRQALSHGTALAQMRANVGSQFDPQVVAALLAVISTSQAEIETALALAPAGDGAAALPAAAV